MLKTSSVTLELHLTQQPGVDGEESTLREDYTIMTVEKMINGRVRMLAMYHAVSKYIDHRYNLLDGPQDIDQYNITRSGDGWDIDPGEVDI